MGKTRVQIVALWIAVCGVPVSAIAGSSGTLDGLMGFGAGTTGGDTSNVCKVKRADSDSLIKAVACASRGHGGVVNLNGLTITPTIHIDVASNITIQGPGTIYFNHDVFTFEGRHNVIIKNITFNGIPGAFNAAGLPCPVSFSVDSRADGAAGTTGCPVAIHIIGSQSGVNRDSMHFWIDHNTFNACGDKCVVMTNGRDRDAGGQWTGVTGVTISNNIFENSHYAVYASDIEDARVVSAHDTATCMSQIALFLPSYVSLYGNRFFNIKERQPRASYCNFYLHAFNNAVMSFGLPRTLFTAGTPCDSAADGFGFGPSAIYGARIYLESNYISAFNNDPSGCKIALDVIQHQVNGTGTPGTQGYFTDLGNVYVNGATGTGAKDVVKPSYGYKVLQPADVLSYVQAHAGARSQ